MTQLLRALCTACILIIPSTSAVADFSQDKLALIDRLYQGERVALSPDGRHLAYTSPEQDKLMLVLVDLERKARGSIVLTEADRKKPVPLRLAELRWVTNDRLLMVNSDAEIISIDANGANPRRLWDKGDNGLVNDTEFSRERYQVNPGVPRVHPSLSDLPGSVLIESLAQVGAETLVNAYIINAVTGETKQVDGDRYLSGQIALYGRGDMLMWPSIPRDMELWVRSPGRGIASLVDVSRYFSISSGDPDGSRDEIGSPYITRSKMELFLNLPPTDEGGVLDLHGWPMPPRTDPLPPVPNATSLSPESGGAVSPDSSSTGRMLYDRQGRPRLLYMEGAQGGSRTFLYTAPDKPAFEPNQRPATIDSSLGQPKSGEFLLSADNYFGERSYPLAFDYDPNVLYVASNRGRDTYGIYALNLTTMVRSEVATETSVDFASGDPADAEGILVFDDARRKLVGVRFSSLRKLTRWLDPELAEVQVTLNAMVPRTHTVEILSWDTTRSRFLVRATSEADPGAVFIYYRGEKQLEQMFTQTPWLAKTELNPSTAFAFKTAAGVLLSGYLTLPNNPKVEPPPLIIYCQGGLWDRATPGFNREAEMLADMGMAVLRLNYRGSAGFGRAHLNSILAGVDTVPVEDVIAAVEFLAASKRIDSKRVAVMGEGFGGYIALRAVQLHPDIFRAGITLNAPTNLNAWAQAQSIVGVPNMYSDGSIERGGTVDFRSEVRAAFVKKALAQSGQRPAPPRGAADRPLLVIESADSSDTTPLSSALAGLGLGLRGLDVERLRIRGSFENGTPAVRSQVFRRIDEFLTATVYNFEVQVGPLKTIDEPAPAKSR